jgi:hypothetical protein
MYKLIGFGSFALIPLSKKYKNKGRIEFTNCSMNFKIAKSQNFNPKALFTAQKRRLKFKSCVYPFFTFAKLFHDFSSLS